MPTAAQEAREGWSVLLFFPEKLKRRNWFSEIGKEQFWEKKVRSGGTLDMLSMSCLPDPHKLRSIC